MEKNVMQVQWKTTQLQKKNENLPFTTTWMIWRALC